MEAGALKEMMWSPQSPDIFALESWSPSFRPDSSWTRYIYNRDSVRKAREAYLIERDQTLQPRGLNKKDETFSKQYCKADYPADYYVESLTGHCMTR